MKRGSDDWTVCMLFPVSCSVIFKPGISFFSGLSCQSVSHSLSNLLVIVSAANRLVSHWRALICCNLMSQNSVALSVANLSVCGKGHWSAAICFCSFVSAGAARSLLLSAVWVSRETGSFAAFCVHPVYTTVSGCIHRHSVARYSPSSCLFRCCQHNCCPLHSKCTHSDCPLRLSCISVIVRAHFRASCLRLLLAAKLYENLT